MTARVDIERRAFVEVRASARTLTGYAAVFNTDASVGGFTETIAPGAFAESLRSNADVLALFDHDMGKVLGRTKSGTLRLTEDAKGLRFELSLPDTQAGRDVVALAERNDLGGLSFGFVVHQGGDSWNGDRRTLRTVDLREISVVSAHPAYPDTTLALRYRQHTVDAERRRRAIILASISQ